MADNCLNCKFIKEEDFDDPCYMCEGFNHWEQKPKQTNADRIRAMSDEELAKELERIDDTACAFNRPRTYEGWLDWLKKEVDE